MNPSLDSTTLFHAECCLFDDSDGDGSDHIAIWTAAPTMSASIFLSSYLFSVKGFLSLYSPGGEVLHDCLAFLCLPRLSMQLLAGKSRGKPI